MQRGPLLHRRAGRAHETLDFDSYQARAVLTYLVNAAGHHVLKAGFDGQINKYTPRRVVHRRGRLWRRAGSRRPGRDGLRRCPLRPPRPAPTPSSTRHGSRPSTKSTILGGFIQDSWSVLDKVTLNLGLRYDALTMQGQDGKTRISLKDQLSPRVGLVWDPTQQGRSKLFVNYGRYYEYIPLDIADRSLSSSQSGHPRRPRVQPPAGRARQGCDANTRTDGQNLINGVTQAPNRKWAVTGRAVRLLRGPQPQVAGQRRDRRRRRVRGPAQRTRRR